MLQRAKKFLRDFLSYSPLVLCSNGNGKSDWSLHLITDDEAALHGAFTTVFGQYCQHTLCSIHVWGNLKSKLREVGMGKAEIRAIKFDIMGVNDIDNQTYHSGLIDAESDDKFIAEYDACKTRWESQYVEEKIKLFARYFEKEYLEKFRTKLTLAARKRLGFGEDLLHTNYVEAFHSSYRRRIGTTHDHRIVIHSLSQLAGEQLNTMALALRNEGDFVLRDEYEALLIPRSQMNDAKVVQAKLRALMFGDPGETILTKRSVADVANSTIPKRLPAPQVATVSKTAMFLEFDETALDLAYFSVWNKARDIYLKRTQCPLFHVYGIKTAPSHVF